MKPSIHPKWNHDAVVKCGCGNTFTTGSAQDELQVDTCSACHPFYTGSMKFVDAQGRVDRFMKQRAAAEANTAKKKKNDKKSGASEETKTLKELLQEEKERLAKTATA